MNKDFRCVNCKRFLIKLHSIDNFSVKSENHQLINVKFYEVMLKCKCGVSTVIKDKRIYKLLESSR